MPQPYFVPVSPMFSRIAQSSGVSGSTSTSIVLPLIVRFAIFGPLDGLEPLLERDVVAESETVQIKNPRLMRREQSSGSGVAPDARLSATFPAGTRSPRLRADGGRN